MVLGCFLSAPYSHAQGEYKQEQLQKIDSTVNSYKLKDKYKYLNLLPNVSYDAFNNAFNVGFSLTGLANYYQQRQRNKIELAQLENRLKERLENDIEKINLEVEVFLLDCDMLKSEIDLFEIDHDLFTITKGKYDNKEITTEEYLKLKRSYLKAKQNLKTRALRLRIKAALINEKINEKKFITTADKLIERMKKYE